jgi:regulator of RNase E activity RraA
MVLPARRRTSSPDQESHRKMTLVSLPHAICAMPEEDLSGAGPAAVFRDFGKTGRFAGQATGALYRRQLARIAKRWSPGEGRVLIVDGGGSCGRRQAATYPRQLRRRAATMVDGAGVSSRARRRASSRRACADAPVKQRGEGQATCRCHPGRGGTSGDWLYADEDGIVVSYTLL